MKQNRQCKLQGRLLGLAIAACFGSVQANPVAPQVVAGQASFQQQGNVFTVTNTPNTIINWQAFSIDAGEVTRFLQQGADSKVLNRITGQDPSRILGSLQSNGQVYLLNPNGIVFGKDARIDVQGLAASSLGMSNADFLAGRLHFGAQGAAGKVENQGSITTAQGGRVFLVAPNVENSGIITAPGGAVMLAAGHSVQLVDVADPALQVVVSAPADSALNLGQVVAQGGRIGMFGALVNQRGVVSADSAVLGENGKVLLRSSGRTMVENGSRTSAHGGEVAILGPQVGVTGNARVDAGAAAGGGHGGTVLVGGDFRGANAAVPNARQVYVGRDAVLSADAGAAGSGGKVVVWADEVARVHGAISARGGAQGGDGGLVETSARQLELAGLRVDAGAAQGKRGQWLLDPYDIMVKNAPDVPSPLSDVATFASGAATGVTEVATSLINSATADVTLEAKHDITFSDEVAISQPAVGLIAHAGNHIHVNARLSTNGGTVKLVANDSNSGAATGSGSVNLAAGIDTGVGAIDLTGAGLKFGVGAALVGQELRLKADKMEFTPGASLSAVTNASIKAVTSGAAITLGGSDGSPGVLNLTSAGLAAISAQSLTIGDAASALTVSGPLDLLGSNAGSAMLTLAGSSLSIAADLKPKAGLYLQTGGAISGAGKITAPSLFASGGSIALTGPNQVNVLAAAADGNISFSNASSLHLGSTDGLAGVQTTGAVTLDAPSIGQDFDAPVLAGTLTLKSSGQVNLATSSDNHATTLVAQNIGGLDYSDSGSLDISSLTLAPTAAGGYLHVNASSLTVSGTADGGNGSLDLQGGNLALAGSALVKGREIRLRGEYESVQTAGGSRVEGNYVALEAGSMELGGTIKGVYDASLPESGHVSFANYGGDIRVGDGLTGAGLLLDSAKLGKVTAGRVSIRNVLANNQVQGAGAMTVGTLDLSAMALSEELVLQSATTVDLGGSIKLPSAASLMVEAAGVITSGARLEAYDVDLHGAELVFNGATGSGIVANALEINSQGDIELGGTNATTAPRTYLSGSVLDSFNVSRLLVSSGGTVTVGAAIGTAARDLHLESLGGLLTVAAPVLANHVQLNGDTINLTDTVTANIAVLAPGNSGKTVTVGAACGAGCLSLTQLDKVAAATVGIGDTDDVDGVTALTLAGPANLNPVTTRLGLLSKGSVTQDATVAGAALTVQELGVEAGANVALDHAGNQIGKLAATVDAGDLTFRNGQSLAITRLQGGSVAEDTDYDINGVNVSGIATFNIAGDLSSNGATIAANKLAATTSGSIGTATAPLLSKVALLHAESTAAGGNAPIRIVNNQGAPAQLSVLKMQVNSGNSGSVTLDNYGATVVPSGATVASDSGNISITAHSPLTIDGSVQSTSGNIALAAGSSGSPSDNLTIGATALVQTATGTIKLAAGAAISYASANVQAPSGGVSTTSNLNTPPATLPTIDQCIANPTATGCQTVLPPLDSCVVTPTAPGCQVVLPPLNTCVATPTAPGCQVVLPPLDTCVVTPTAPGCQVVLPPLATCVATPTAPGCQAVLPPLATCVATPTAPGCQAVLPPLATCVATPTAPGCQAVLPPLATCVATPTAPGCQAVLPSLNTCVATPTAVGCQVVLPSLNNCVATPTAPGCQVVLPPLDTCVTTPAAPGCQVVLPPLHTCVTTPTAAGCQVVLPPLHTCVTTPTAPGCQVVLPPVDACVANPTAPGCQVVLPPLATCVATPSAPGCQAVLPPLAVCVATPSASGCQAVLPSLDRCAANPALSGCEVVIPRADQCVLNPTLALCQVVAPPTAVEPAKPVQQAVQQTVELVNKASASVSMAEQAAPASAATGGTAPLAGSPDDKKASKNTDSEKAGASDAPLEVIKNESVKKMYCN
jgi:filamentous hemagglutinin family protein